LIPVAKCPQVDQKARAGLEEGAGMPPRKTPGRGRELPRFGQP
jgi:hypothetical protein